MTMSAPASNESELLKELEWIQVRDEINAPHLAEPFADKLVRKTLENPLVPIGSIATVAALVFGLYNFTIGNSRMSNYMMRARVGAQAFTICAMVGGFIIAARR